MITLYSFGPGFGLPELSPYCLKTEVQLKMAGLAYRKQPAMPSQSPKGQLPFIDDDGRVTADSTFIRFYLEDEYAIDFDRGLTPRQWAQAWAVERMLENQLCWTMVHMRWVMPENFAKGPAHFFDRAPEEVQAQLRQEAKGRVADALRAVGVGRHTPDEIVELGRYALVALSELIGDQVYLGGERPCGVDATAFAVLAAILTPYFDSGLRRTAESFPNLVAYVGRMMARFFPEHPWGQAVMVEVEMA